MASIAAADLALALDPLIFARRAGITPDCWQADVLRSHHRRILMNCSRQSGKSTVTALIALHEAIFRTGSLVLLFSPSLRQSSELFRVVSRLYGRIGETVPANAETLLRLELANGSRILSLPASESTVRGYAGCTLAIFDEASRVEDDLYLAVLPMLATTNGRVIGLSTPAGRRGWWATAWHDGGSAWERVRITAGQCPRISPQFLAEQEASMGRFWFDQEFMCLFLDNDSQAFRSEDIEASQGEWVDTWTL